MAKETLAERLRNSINKRLEAPVTKVYTEAQDLQQVSDWIEMPKFFQDAVGGPGFPCGHIAQIVGESDTGKTTLLMEAMISTQKSGGICFLIDSEHKFSFKRFREMGGDPSALNVMSVDSLEQAWSAMHAVVQEILAIRKANPDIKIFLAWDSSAASVPESLLAADSDDHHVSVEAKINNKEIRKIRFPVKKANVACVFINHTYMTMPKWGTAKEILKGGTEMFFLSTLIVKTKRRAWLDRVVNKVDIRFGIHSLLEVFKGHLTGEKPTTEFFVVGKGILPDKASLDAYRQSLLE